VAREFNTARRSFPTVLIANFFGFEPKAYFEATAGAEAPPKVEF
jgi:LemA protein